MRCRTLQDTAGGARTQDFIEALQGFSAVAVRVDADLVAKPSAEQPVNGHTQRLTQQIPKCGLDAANGVVDDPRNRTGSGGPQAKLPKETVNVARVFANDERLQRLEDGRETGGKETLTESA